MLVLARELSLSPGVYLMKDETSHVIYIGKAKALKNRVSSYFQAAVHESPRTEMMVGRVHRFDVILTETEAEALILENSLIKKHKPKFNVRLKDDKTYPYLRINVADPFPRLEWTRKVRRDQARYFGPFPSAWAARQVMYLLNETFRLRDCSDNTFQHRSRPCILHQMGKCSGSCVRAVDERRYREDIEQVIAVLEGRSNRLVEALKAGMADAAEREEYERAAEYRDQLQNLELVTATQTVDEAGSPRDRDVIGLARRESDAHGVVLIVRGGRLLAVRHYHLQNTDAALSDGEILGEFLAQYYLDQDRTSGEDEGPGAGARRPQEVLLPVAPPDPALIERALQVGVRTAESPVEEQLLSVARTNAQYALEQAAKRGKGHGARALEEVQDKLQLPRLPQRIECFDISNFQGEDSVASRVVFIDGAPDKNLYRRYKIRTVEGANDFASMREVLGRRFGNAEEALPDLVVVDGGKGQLAQATAILDELGVQGVGVVGLAKARTESDFQAVEVRSSMERVFIPGRKNPVALPPHTEAYKLLVHVRDEAHRFAITYHRKLRDKRSLKSERS